MTRFRYLLYAAVVTLSFVCLGADSQTPTANDVAPSVELPLPPEHVVSLVSRTIAWYRRMVALQQLPADSEDVLPRDRFFPAALTTLQLAFEFGHAAASLASKAQAQANNAAQAQDAQNPTTAVDQAVARLADRISSLESQLSAIDQQLAHAGAKERETLVARRAALAAALDLAKEIQQTVAQIQHFEESSEAQASGSTGGLAGQIADLRRSVPELRAGPPAPATASAPGSAGSAAGPAPSASAPASASTAAPSAGAAANTAAFRPESAGVIALLGKWFSLEGERRQLTDATKQTDDLAKGLAAVRNQVSQLARSLAQQSLDVAATDPAQIAQAKQKLQDAAVRFKQLSTLIIPLGEQGIAVESARNVLQEWRDSVTARTGTVARYLALRLGFLLGSIAVVLVISEFWRRATFRYLHDERRRQQFLALRRVAIGVALSVVIIFGLVSEMGSLATYAGLITAGLAVALQNVILAVVAYFFLIGRYGVRVGDRITLAGVTGRVVEIGLVRIYLMELAGPLLRSTGRMVVLSNAVLFQPTALFKQMPGGDFLWHNITLTLAAATDVAAAEKRLREAAESVYEKYRPAIEQQHAALQRFIEFQTALPRPEIYARLTAKGLECTIRYPVEPAQAVATDQQMLIAVREALSKPPALELVDGPLLDTSDV